jgi:hypothetical protein
MTQNGDFHNEADVLVPVPNALLTVDSENSWPDFKLADAEVRDRQGNLVNLFTASVDNLLELSGTLKTSGIQDKLYCKFSRVSSVRR